MMLATLAVKMAVNKLRLNSLLLCLNFKTTFPKTPRACYCSQDENSTKNEKPAVKKLKFLEFHEKKEEYLKTPKSEPESFVSLLRNSTFIDLGDPRDKVVIGEIYHVMEDNLYIDFGWKFPTVCTCPVKMKDQFVRGAKVRLLIKDLELSARFLSGNREISLNEADCVLLGLAKTSQSKNVESKVESVTEQQSEKN